MKQDNRGLTLIELIIAIAVSVIIMGALILFVSGAMRSYSSATATIDLQMESHVMMEQLGSWIMEGNRIEVVNGVTVQMDGSSSTVDNVLVIYRIPRTSDVGRLPTGMIRDADGKLATPMPGGGDVTITASKRLIWMQDGKLLMKVVDGIDDFDNDVTSSVTVTDPLENSICEYMQTFEPTWDEDKGTVKINVDLKAGTQEYQLQNEFKVRNEIMGTPSPVPGS